MPIPFIVGVCGHFTLINNNDAADSVINHPIKQHLNIIVDFGVEFHFKFLQNDIGNVAKQST